ncbi:MAG TPA: aldo/keto reductase [Steroidobacteraceae bacterium]|jgi:aryl-alcohol dehydrogenase-like predicted oxidoreductase|nr:aldo/keto reductase [Steroidobacteraceae bacterium]
MQLRTLGRSGLQVAPLCLGGNVFGWTANEEASFAVLDAFVGAGLNFIDTADVYSVWVPGHRGGESETAIGNWLKRGGARKDVVIATKVGMKMASDRKGLSAAHIARSAEDSLRRLQTDYIDLYFSHCDDTSVPLEETLGAYQKLIAAGKVRAIGASNYTAPRFAEALEVSRRSALPRYEVLQPHYNLHERSDYESALEPLCLEHQIGVVGYYALASGFLSGKYRTPADASKSARGKAIVEKFLNERGLRILAALDEVARRYRASDASVALAWQIARPSITAPIASATTVAQVRELAAGAQLQLDQAAIEQLNAASR